MDEVEPKKKQEVLYVRMDKELYQWIVKQSEYGSQSINQYVIEHFTALKEKENEQQSATG